MMSNYDLLRTRVKSKFTCPHCKKDFMTEIPQKTLTRTQTRLLNEIIIELQATRQDLGNVTTKLNGTYGTWNWFSFCCSMALSGEKSAGKAEKAINTMIGILDKEVPDWREQIDFAYAMRPKIKHIRTTSRDNFAKG